jgi:hypothetical protein
MTTVPGASEGTEPGAPSRPAADDAVGGEVRIGGGPTPRWLRSWYALVYLWAALYLIVLAFEGLRGAWIIAVFGGLLIAWLVYIVWKKRPPEP